MMNVTLKINDRESWLELYWELKECGLLTNVTVEDIAFGEDAFPMEIPMDVGNLVKLVSNPIVKPFKKKMNESLERTLGWVMN